MNRKSLKIKIFIIGIAILFFTGLILHGVHFDNEAATSYKITDHPGLKVEALGSQDGCYLYPERHGYYAVSLQWKEEEPLQYYEVSTFLDITDAICLDLPLGFTGNLQNDINAWRLQPLMLSGEEGTAATVKRVILTDEYGKGEQKLLLGDESHKWSGRMQAGPLQLRKCIDSGYLFWTSDDGKIEFLMLREDLQKLGISEETVQKLMKELSKLRESLVYLSGDYEPFDGKTRFVFTEELTFTGLAGNPIYINRLALEQLFQGELTSRLVGRNHPLFVLCHEMSHTFDFSKDLEGECGYTFDRELFASLKAIYALELCGYQLEFDLLRVVPGIETGVYNYESLLALILQGVEEKQLPESWLHDITKELRRTDINAGANVKYDLFVKWMKEHADLDLQEYLGEKGWDTVVKAMKKE